MGDYDARERASASKMGARVRRGPAAGLGLVLLAAAGCAVRSTAERQYPGLAPYAGREVRSVSFANPGIFAADTLRQIVRVQPTQCTLLGLPFCLPFTSAGRHRHTLDPATVAADVQRLVAFYRIGGFFGTQVRPEVEPVPGDSDDVRVRFDIAPGDSVVLDSLRLTGLDTVLEAATVAPRLPSEPGHRFDLARFALSADSLSGMLHSRGHAFARVLRNYTVDTVAARATAELVAIPGPLVHIDSIRISGGQHLSRTGVRRQLAFRPGDELLASKLVESQRNLYSLEIVQLATVSVAPDSLQLTPADSGTATVQVQVVEAPEHQVDASVGWGQIECFRTGVSWVDRSFLGGAHRLALNADVSKIGVGQGLGGSACNAFSHDTLAGRTDYRVGADLTQPYFFSPRNHLAVSAYAERQSEPSVFQRTDRGGSFSVAHRLTARAFLTVALAAEQGQTLASSAVFCTALLVCDSTAIQQATRYRWLNRLSASYALDRSDAPVSPTRGFTLRTTADWAAPWLLSTTHFTRLTTEFTHYNRMGRGVVLAKSLRFGTFFQTGGLLPQSNFLPPEERFYAGGASSVRGFERNLLGPGVWWTDKINVGLAGDTTPANTPNFAPTGGRAVGIANLELRTPAPIWRNRLRMAWFVDAGSVVTEQVWSLGGWRVTPGAGLRAETPVGPFRIDVAYNGYPPTVGPLYLATGTRLVRLRDAFRPGASSFLGRFHLTLAVGQAF